MLECIINVSEGRDTDSVAAIAAAGDVAVVDVHADAHHNRAVLTLVGPDVEDAARAVAVEAVHRIDLRLHVGVHPRMGAVDVVPFVPLATTTIAGAIRARDDFATWAATHLGLPCFLYGPERALPDLRRDAFAALLPDYGPPVPHPTAGAMAVGARPALVAYNLWLTEDASLDDARRVAAAVRCPHVRALGLDVGGTAQVSLNLLDPLNWGPAEAYDAVASHVAVARAELVGLVPEAVLAATDASRRDRLDLTPDRTIEARLAARGWPDR